MKIEKISKLEKYSFVGATMTQNIQVEPL